ncbi:TlpA family protein disulfide reductase [Hugenholtzia roseola]|uniref:TlpA family protein disulfide reductase n=1 Tax=Hugenholtzia roseola TaxID=1002 RepID=UPI000417D3D1|nr:TlpA disulfide reductase family protein [Hugenholtzia roseola]
MKKLWFICLLSLISVAKAQKTTVSFSLPETEKWQLSRAPHALHYHPAIPELSDTVFFEKRGNNLWEATFEGEKMPQTWYLNGEKVMFYFFVQADEKISIRVGEDGVVSFESGKWQAQNQYFHKQNDILQATLSDLYPKEPKDFVKNLYQLQAKRLENYHTTFPKPDSLFDDFMQIYFQVETNQSLGAYPFFHNRSTGKVEMVREMPDAYLDTFPLVKPSKYDFYPYSVIISELRSSYTRDCKQHTLKNKPITVLDSDKKYNYFLCNYQNLNQITSEKLRKLCLQNFLASSLRMWEWQDERFVALAQLTLEELKKLGITEKEATFFKVKFANYQSLSAGKPFPDFSFLDKDEKRVTLESLKGKVVLVDFWATWCAPCVAEFPHSKKLMQTFENQEVVFLNICIDSNQADWEKMLTAHQLGGVQVFVSPEESLLLRKNYQISGIPHYFLLDKNGIILKNKTIRPSQNAAELIEKALE